MGKRNDSLDQQTPQGLLEDEEPSMRIPPGIMCLWGVVVGQAEYDTAPRVPLPFPAKEWPRKM